MERRRKPAQQHVETPPIVPEPLILQDWTPLGRCLEYQMAQAAWLRTGAELLLNQQVPTAGHDSGTVAAHGAQLLAAWCEERLEAGALPAEIVVVELGIGTGAHLRGLLESFRRLCLAQQRDWYGRLVVFATDISPDVLQLVADRQVFATHGVRVRLGLMDARLPGVFREHATAAIFDLRGRIHALWAHYVLDGLPVDLYRRNGETWEIAAVRTLVPDVAAWERAVQLAVVDGQALAANGEVESAARLAPGQLLTRLEVLTLPFAIAEHPDAAELQRAADAQLAALGQDHPLLTDGLVLHHAAGALRMLPLLHDALAPDGFAVLRDVGLLTPEMAAQSRLPQRFGRTMAMPVDFVQLDGWMAAHAPNATWLAPLQDGLRDHATRLLSRLPLPATNDAFVRLFSAEVLDRGRALAEQARQETEPTAVLEAWRQAALAEPDDWLILHDAAEQALALGQVQLGLAIAARGLELNPVTVPALWRLAGTAHALVGDVAAAEQALRQGLAIAPTDAGLHLALARLAADVGQLSTAFEHVGAALAGDRSGTWRPTALFLLDALLRADEVQRQAETTAWTQRFVV
jgi:tetratricopeptide (TPR) repeat protein